MAEALAPCRSLLLRLALASLLPLAASAEPAAALRPSAIFNVKSFGATGDGSRLETTALQRAIDACHENAGGTVLVPAGSYITGTLKLRSHVTLRIESGAVLLGSQDLADYANDIQGAVEAPVFSKCLLYAEGATNVAFEGAGRIDGRHEQAHKDADDGDDHQEFDQRKCRWSLVSDGPFMIALAHASSSTLVE